MDAGHSIVYLFLEEPTIVEVYEDFSEYKITACSTNISIPSINDFQRVLSSFSADDKVVVDLKMDEGDPITIASGYKEETIRQYFGYIQDEIDIKDEDSIFFVSVTVFKNITQARVSIYCFEKFVDYLNGLSLTGLLTGFRKVLLNQQKIIFNLFDFEDEFFTDTFIFSSDDQCQQSRNVDRQAILESANKIRYFLKASEYPFIPEDFRLKKRSRNTVINSIMDRLTLVYCIVYLVDISDIKNNDTLWFRCCGYRTIEGIIDYKILDTKPAPLVYDIYQWVYTEGNLTDKIGIARNVITLHSNSNALLDITEKTYESIKSNYTIYLKQNLQQYIDIKNQVTQLLYEMSQKTNGVIDNFTEVFSKNIQWLFTFYISVLIFNTLATGRLQNIFTKDIAYLSFGILAVSLVILGTSILQLILKKSRFIEQYYEVKKYYEDLLDQNDINRIFQYDCPQKSNLEYITNRMWIYIIAWIIMIALMGTVTYLLMQ